MKVLLVSLVMLLSANAYTAATGGDLFKGAELAAKYQCSENVKEYDFIMEYATLTQFDTKDNISRDEENLKKLREVSDFVEQDFKETCKNKKYLAGGWNFQGCLNKCNEAFKKKEGLINKCVATCNSLKNKIDSLVFILGNAVAKKIVFTDSKCKNTPVSKVNNSGRGKIKEATADDRMAGDQKGSVGR